MSRPKRIIPKKTTNQMKAAANADMFRAVEAGDEATLLNIIDGGICSINATATRSLESEYSPFPLSSV